MKYGLGVVAVMTVLFSALGGAAARAEPADVTLGVTVNAMNGKHEVDRGISDTFALLPLPLGELTIRHGADTLRIEGLPPVTFTYPDSIVGTISTRLSIANATYRRSVGGGWFAGIGQTIYNQSSTYDMQNRSYYYSRGPISERIDGSEVQYSRVTGLRLEAGRAFAVGHERLEVSAAVNPRMHGIAYTRVPTFFLTCTRAGCSQFVDTFADPENASQVDLAARFSHRLSRRGELIYGLRYLNFTARYDDFPTMLADRNVGIAGVLGLRVRL